MTAIAHIAVPADTLPEKAAALLASGGRMHMAYAWQPDAEGIEIRYLTSAATSRPFELWVCHADGRLPSLADVWPLLSWYEREITDLFGVVFSGQPEPGRLVLHDGVSPDGPPFARSPNPAAENRSGFDDNASLSIPDVQELPFGPVRADVVESAKFHFHYTGEHIIQYRPELFFKHRGMEKRFEGQSPECAVILAERISGIGSFCHALAFCQAVEKAAGCEVPERARLWRSILAELERLYNHLHYFGHLCHTTTLKVGEAQGKLLEERAKQINGRLTGSRFLRSLLTPGGLRRDLTTETWFPSALERFKGEIADYLGHLDHSESHVDRLMGTGVLGRELARDEGATGPVERASGVDRDLRRDHPYAAYDRLSIEIPVQDAGDAYARAKVRAAEMLHAVELMLEAWSMLAGGPVKTVCDAPAGGEGFGWSESPRGTLYYAVHFADDGRLARVKVKSPSFSNWRVFPHTVHDSNMMDYAINEASFGLTIAGCDR